MQNDELIVHRVEPIRERNFLLLDVSSPRVIGIARKPGDGHNVCTVHETDLARCRFRADSVEKVAG
jgi:hypothetical protein